jgi:hypothetical protein
LFTSSTGGGIFIDMVIKTAKHNENRIAYSYQEFAEMIGKHRTWVYRMAAAGKIKTIIGYGAALVPASEVERFRSGGAA